MGEFRTVRWEGRQARRGAAAIAGLLFMLIVVMYFISALTAVISQYEASRAIDRYYQLRIERGQLADVAEEAFYATRGTRNNNESDTPTNAFISRINDRDYGNITYSVESSDMKGFDSGNPNTFFPDSSPSLSDLSSVAGVANNLYPSATINRFYTAGNEVYQPHLPSDPLTLNVRRTLPSGKASENPVFELEGHVIGVPISNIDVLAYGLPASGDIPDESPSGMSSVLNNAFRNAGGRSLTVTSGDPAKDPTAFPELYGSTASSERIPSYYRHDIEMAWNMPEYVFGFTSYRNELANEAKSRNTLWDFAQEPYNNNPNIDGLSYDEPTQTLTVTMGAITDQQIVVQDGGTGGNVVINGTNSGGSAMHLSILNDDTTPTNVTINGNNNRPFMLYTESISLGFSGNPTVTMALLMEERTSVVFPSPCTIEGSVAFYSMNNYFPAWQLSVTPSDAVKDAVASLAPRALLVDFTPKS